MTERTQQPSVSLGAYSDQVTAAVSRVERDDIVTDSVVPVQCLLFTRTGVAGPQQSSIVRRRMFQL